MEGSTILVQGVADAVGEELFREAVHGRVACPHAVRWVRLEKSRSTGENLGYGFCDIDAHVIRPRVAAERINGLVFDVDRSLVVTARVASNIDLRRCSGPPPQRSSFKRSRSPPQGVPIYRPDDSRGKPRARYDDRGGPPHEPQYSSQRQHQVGRGRGDQNALQLFLGNTPHDMTSRQLIDLLNTAMRQGGLTIPSMRPEEPVINVRLGKGFSFATFCDAETCTLGMNLNGIKVGGSMLRVSRPKNYHGPPVPSVTWFEWMRDRIKEHPELAGRVVGMPSESEFRGGPNLPSSRGPQLPELQVFVGNIPLGLNPTALIDFLSQAMIQSKLCDGRTKPIRTCRVNNKFAFVEFYQAEVATRALHMTGIPFMGQDLNLGRPKNYAKKDTNKSATWATLLQTNFDLPKAILLANSSAKGGIKDEIFVDMARVPVGVRTCFQAGMPSKSVVFSQLAGIESPVNAIEEEIKRYIQAKSMDYNASAGVLTVEFGSLYDAGLAVLMMSDRKLDGKDIQVSFGK